MDLFLYKSKNIAILGRRVANLGHFGLLKDNTVK